MSADNGIYILKTKEGQHRIIHAQAIDNLWRSFIDFNQSREMVSTRIVEFYGSSKYTRDPAKALMIASSMERGCYICEYGIRTFVINKTWKQIVREAKELAKLELEAIKRRANDGRWNYDIERLEAILSA